MIIATAFLQSNDWSKNNASADEPTFISISSAYELNKIGRDITYPLNANYILTSDIDFDNGVGGYFDFLPIGLKIEEETNAIVPSGSFMGIFNGNGYKIKNVQLINLVYPYYAHAIFASSQNAIIKNLAVENMKVERTNVFPSVASNQSTVYVGGLVAMAENTFIDQCYVTFDASSISGTTSIYYGGIVAKAFAGTVISNSYAVNDFVANVLGEQAIEIKMGGIAGSLENATAKVVHSKGNLKSFVSSEGQLSPITESAVGGLVGYVTGYNSKIISSYVDMLVYAETINQNAETLVGGLVALVSENPSSTPKKDNLSFAQIRANTLSKVGGNYVIVALSEAFGLMNDYDKTSSILTIMSQNNYESFYNASLWSPYQDFTFDFNLIWTFQANSLPTLQKFTQYQIALKKEETRVNLGENTASTEVVDLRFAGNGAVSTFRHGDEIQVLISLINGYDYYYFLESVELDLTTKVCVCVSNINYNIELLSEEDDMIPNNIESDKVYLLTYTITDATKGDISVTLNKVPFNLTVETSDETMGLVRKKDSTVARQSFSQELQNANSYDFFAVAVNNDYAFSKWVFVLQEDGETQTIELGNYANFAQLTFVFGIGGQEEVTENVLAGAKLVAIFTSNVTKVQFLIQVPNQEDGSVAGYISTTIGGEAIDISNLITYLKDSAVTLIANANEGYVFEGWFDGDNRSLSNESNPTTLNFIPSEDEQVLVARFKPAEQTVNLTWLWIVLGVVGTIGLGLGIFFIVRSKTGDRAYKNFY